MVGTFKLVVNDTYAARSLAFAASALNLLKSGALQLHSSTSGASAAGQPLQIASLSGEWGTFSQLPTIAKAIGAVKEQTSSQRVPWNGQTAMEKAKVSQWLSFSFSDPAMQQSMDFLRALDAELLNNSYLAGPCLTISDIVAYWMVHPVVDNCGDQERNKFPNACRWFDQVQHEIATLSEDGKPLEGQPKFIQFSHEELVLPAVSASSSSSTPAAQSGSAAEKNQMKGKEQPKEEHTKSNKGEKASKSTENKEKAAEKKGKEQKNETAKKEEKKEVEDISVAACEFKVGHIKKVWKHPEAEKLYCEEIDVGEDAPRQIASGLVQHMPMEELENRKVIVVTNLKPRPLVGFKSHGMVLCATSSDKSKVVLLEPPTDAKVGERVAFPGHEGDPASPKNMQKKKVLESILPDLKVNSEGVACWKDVPFTTSAGKVTAGPLREGSIS